MQLLPWDYAIRNLGRHPLRLVLSLAGSTLVVLLVLAASAFVRGMTRSLEVSGNPGNVIMLGAGSEESVERSEIESSVASVVAASIEGVKTKMGVPYVSPEIHVAMFVRDQQDSMQKYLGLLRGVTAAAYLVHNQVRVIEGRTPNAGEVLVGKLAAVKMGIDPSRLKLGSTIWLDSTPLAVSGVFEAPGTVLEAEIWGQLSDLQMATKRSNLSCVVVTLDTADFADVDLFTKQRLDLELTAISEVSYYGKLGEFYKPVHMIVWITALLIALGGLFGGLNTMYAAFAARVRELGMLQALGYKRLALIVSLTQESLLAAIGGALLAALIGALVIDGLAVRISMGAFSLQIDGPVMFTGLLAGLVLGLVGALPPAWRCLRLPLTEALKAS